MAIPRNLANLAPKLSATGGSFSTTIGVGGATPSASGSGITFPASQSASTDVNTLDDYEEGTWTPTISGDNVNFTMTTQEGHYVKIGTLVTARWRIVWTGKGGAGSAFGLDLKGFPFAAKDVTGNGFTGVAIINQTTANQFPIAAIFDNLTQASFRDTENGNLDVGSTDTSGTTYGNITYITNS